MDFTQLRNIGLTEGEIAVYGSLAYLGQTSTGKLMKKANISSSKIYLILERLIQKGLVSSSKINDVNYYQITEPKTILDYIESKKEELDKTGVEMKKVILSIRGIKKSETEDSCQVYKGFKGIKSSYLNILEELESGEEYRIFAMSGEDIIDPEIQTFFMAFHRQRIAKGIKLKILINSDSVENYVKNNLPVGSYVLRHHPLTLPVSMAIGRHRITSMSFHPENIAYETISDEMTQKYKEYFEKIWAIAKPWKK